MITELKRIELLLLLLLCSSMAHEMSGVTEEKNETLFHDTLSPGRNLKLGPEEYTS
jgi:hypothetical protein